MSKLAKALTAAAGNAGGGNLYVEDVFSTYLYTGNGTTQTITNDIDLDGEGGLVWNKLRASAGDHTLYDTARGVKKELQSNTTGAQVSRSTGGVTAFNSNGFAITKGDSNDNISGETYASWTFRKAEKFFDVVTWTGDGVAGREIAHNLGSAPAVIIIKSVSFANNWLYNHNFGASGYDLLYLDLANAKSSQTYASGAIQAQPTDSSFTLKNSNSVNGSGNTYVAYLFASDAGGFGDDGSESIIKCGSFTTDASGAGLVGPDLGFEPQWVLLKNATSTASGGWWIFDVMRGFTASGGGTSYLLANSSGAEGTFGGETLNITSNGFTMPSNAFASGQTFIYIAIRRPMKTPESGTEVFMPTVDTTAVSLKSIDVGFPTDFALQAITEGGSTYASSRLTGNSWLVTNTTAAESAGDGTFYVKFDQQDIFSTRLSDQDNVFYNFKRATGFFDVVAYTGDGTGASTGRDINHNLGVVPDLMIIKKRNNTRDWRVGGPSVNFSSGDYEYNGSLNSDITFDGGNAGTAIIGGIFYYYRIPTIGHTATTFRVGYTSDVNASGDTYIAYLFATLAGVSKVGSYTGTGSNVDVDCGFSAGARFILIKRTDSTGDWYVWDSVRGIVAGNDPYLLLNSTAAEVTSTDYIDPLASGFTVTSSAPAALNASGGTYIFLAIAQVT